MQPPLLRVEQLSVQFQLKTGQVLHALTDVSLQVQAGETLGIVGESGCGKSTLARAILQLVTPTMGAIQWQGQTLSISNKVQLKAYRRAVQCIFQDPLDALNPRMTIAESVQEPLRALRPDLSKAAMRERVDQLLQAVGLDTAMRERYPHEFSGGQCQRIGIARALAVEPQLVVCDEAVSALDVSLQGQIIALLAVLQRQHQLTLLFISHDLGVVKRLCQRVMVLYLGRVMEVAAVADLFAQPLHPYTRLLLAAIPLADPHQERARLAERAQVSLNDGELPSPLNPPSGCVFHTRCPQVQAQCRTVVPLLRAVDGRQVACHQV